MQQHRFIHVPKNGGQAVVDFCRRYDLPVLYGRAKRGSTAVVGKHLTVDDWQHENSQKFAVIRNPLTRLVSWFRYLSALGAYRCSWSEFVTDRVEPRARGFKTPSPWRPQIHWFGSHTHRQDLTLFAFESMSQDIPVYFGIHGHLAQLNVTNHDHADLMQWYDDDQRQQIQHAFEQDFVIWRAVSCK